jgi:hypothetical protein
VRTEGAGLIKPMLSAIAVLACLLAASACAASDYSGLGETESVAPGEVDEAEVTEPPPDVEVEEASARWTCVYAPTMDNDWHNDVLCSNGEQEERPYLRKGDDFVTEAEIMDSAAEYERQLNGE